MEEIEKSLQVVENTSFFKRFFVFLTKFFKKNKVNYFINNTNTSDEKNNKNNFINSIKHNENPDNILLLKIQDELEKKGINYDNAYELTKNLTNEQKIKLSNLYKEQINNFESSIENSKNKIISIRKQISC